MAERKAAHQTRLELQVAQKTLADAQKDLEALREELEKTRAGSLALERELARKTAPVGSGAAEAGAARGQGSLAALRARQRVRAAAASAAAAAVAAAGEGAGVEALRARLQAAMEERVAESDALAAALEDELGKAQVWQRRGMRWECRRETLHCTLWIEGP